MIAATPPGTELLSDEGCWQLFAGATVGRLAIEIAGKPDIFPINDVVDNGAIEFHPGSPHVRPD